MYVLSFLCLLLLLLLLGGLASALIVVTQLWYVNCQRLENTWMDNAALVDAGLYITSVM